MNKIGATFHKLIGLCALSLLVPSFTLAGRPQNINDTDRLMCYNVGRYYTPGSIPKEPQWQPALRFAMVQEIGRGSNMYRSIFKDSGTFYFEIDSAKKTIKSLHVLINHRDKQGNLYHCEYDEISVPELKDSYVINRHGPINIVTLNGKKATALGGEVDLEMLRNFYSLIRRYNSVTFKVDLSESSDPEFEGLPVVSPTRDNHIFSFIGFERDGNKGIKKVIFCKDEECSAQSHLTELDFEL